MLFRSMVTALLALALSGCGAAAFTIHDLQLSASGNTLYVLARSTNVSRNFGDPRRDIARGGPAGLRRHPPDARRSGEEVPPCATSSSARGRCRLPHS
jgi:hypothetical protein